MHLKALIFDVDGTLAETEEIHRKAFNRAFNDAELDWHWNRECYRELLAVSGGKERILHHIKASKLKQAKQNNLTQWIADLHLAKTNHYARIMATGEVELRPGVERLIHQAHAEGLRLAIATTTTMSNITALFNATLGSEIQGWFEVIGAAEQAAIKKPDPSVYLWVLQQLKLPAAACLAIEDTHNGLNAAKNADIQVLVTQSYYSEGEDFSGALAVLSDLGEPTCPYQVLAGVDVDPGWVTSKQLQSWFATSRN